MKKIIFLLFFLPIFAAAQYPAPIFIKPNNSYGTRANRGEFDSTLYYPPGCGVPTDSTFLFSMQNGGKAEKPKLAAWYRDTCGHNTYTWDPSTKVWSCEDCSVTNLGASNGIKAGIFSARPSASSLAQDYYWSTDSVFWSYSDGTNWHDLKPGSGSGGSSLSLTTKASIGNTSSAPTLTSSILNFDTTAYPRIFNVLKYPHVRGDAIDTVVTITAGKDTVVCPNPIFTSTDTGKNYTLDSAGTGGIVQQGTIISFVNSTTVVISTTPQITGSGHHFFYGTESTAGIQACIDSCFNQYGGTVWLPYDKTGMYYIGGPLIDSPFFNAQIHIPYTPSPYVNRRSIRIIGESEYPSVTNFFGATNPIPIRGVTLRSVLTTVPSSSVTSSVIGMSGPTGDTYNPTKLIFDKVYLQDFTIQTYTNRGRSAPVLTAINAFYADNYSSKNVNKSIDVPLSISHDASTAGVAGEIIGQQNNSGINVVEGGYSGGYTYGLVVGEHSILKGPQIFACAYGVSFPVSSYTVSGMVGVTACKHNLYFPATPFLMYASAGLAHVDLDVESERDQSGDIGTFWYNTIDMVSDSANNARGNLRILYNHGGGAGQVPITTVGAGMVHIEPWDNPSPTYSVDSTSSGITQGVFFDASAGTWRYRANVAGTYVSANQGDIYFRSSPLNSSGGGFPATPTTNMFLQGSTGRLQINHYGTNTFTGTATSCAAFDASGHVIEVACGSSGGTPTLDQVLTSGNTSARQLLLTGNNTTSSNLTAGDISLQSYSISNNHIGFNTFFNGSAYQYINTGYGAQLVSNNGSLSYKAMPSGTGGTSASTIFNPLTVNIDGSVSLGGSTPNASFPYTGAYLQISSTGDTVQIPNMLLRAIDTTNTKIIVGDATGNLFKTNWPTFGSGGGAADTLTAWNGLAQQGTQTNDTIGLGGTMAKNTTIAGGGGKTISWGSSSDSLGTFTINSKGGIDLYGALNLNLTGSFDANITVSTADVFIRAGGGPLTANRIIFIPTPNGAPSGRTLIISVENPANNSFHYIPSVAGGANITDPSGTVTLSQFENATAYIITATSSGQWTIIGTYPNAPRIKYLHTIFTPSTGGTVTLVNGQYNIINPSGAIATLTVTLPSSPSNGDVVYIKYTQAVTTVTYSGGTVVDGITAPTAGGLVVLTYDSTTTSWY